MRLNFLKISSIILTIVAVDLIVKAEECRIENIDLQTIDKQRLEQVIHDKWNSFLQKLFLKLSVYDVQKDTSKFMQSIDIDASGSQEFKVTEDNYKSFLNRIKTKLDIIIYDEFFDNSLTASHLEKLNYVLQKTLIQKVSINDCAEPDLIISGNFISLKNIMNLDLNCDQRTLETKRSLQIFAFNTLFIDANITQYILENLKKSLPLAFIAPKWEVIGKILINLDGRDVYDPLDLYKVPPEILEELEKIKQNKNGNIREVDGLPGFPGQRGEFFLGISNKIIGSDNLKITSNGGSGGNGENGQQGEPGKDAEVHPKDANKVVDFCMDNGYYGNAEFVFNSKFLDYKAYVIFPDRKKLGTDGKLGGHGGAKGKGGHAGNVTLIQLNDTQNVQVELKDGKNGLDGKGGPGGFGGKNIPGVCVLWSNGTKARVWPPFDNPELAELKKHYVTKQGFFGNERLFPDVHTKSGDNGTDELNQFTSVEKPYNISETIIVRNYQHYFRENFEISMKQFHEIEFIANINNNHNIENFTHPLDLVDELKELENESFETDKDSDLYLFYEFFLKRIELYETNSNNPKYSQSYKQLLQYLYAATMSRKNSMNQNLNYNFMVEITKSLKNLEIEFTELQKLSTSVNKDNMKNNIIQSMQNFKESFKQNIENKTKSAEVILKKELQSEMNRIKEGFKEEMNKLREEIKEEQQNVSKNGEVLKKSKGTLKKNFISQCLTHIVDATCSVLELAGPKGQAASMAIKVPFKLLNSKAEAEIEEQKKLVSDIKSDITKGLSSMNSKMNVLKQNKGKKLKKLFNDVSDVLKDLPDSDLAGFIENTKKVTENLDINKLSYKNLSQIEEKLNSKINLEKIKLKKEKVNTGKFEKFQKVLEFAEKYSAVPDAAINIFFDYKSYQSDVDGVDKAMRDNEELFKQLKQFENEELPQLMHKLEELKDEVESIRNKVGTASKISLDFLKLKTIDVFDETKNLMRKLLDKYEMKANLFNLIEKLERILPFLVNSNNVVQDFHEQENLIEFITNLNLAPFENSVYDEQTRVIKELQVKLLSNILLKKYKSAYKILEQFVFPFGQKYLAELDLPKHLHFSDNITDFIHVVQRKLNIINARIEDFNLNINEEDPKIQYVPFQGHMNSSDPFFIWKNEEHHDAIAQLLAGNDTLLYADIMKEIPPPYDAVKFSEINIYFRAKNESRQKELDQKLSFFKLKLVHFGDSHYIFNNKQYLVNSIENTVKVSFEKRGNGPASQSSSYKKIRSGPKILSPYALWKVKLEHAPRRKKFKYVEFSEFKEFADEIDLELEGYGSYIDLNSFPELSNFEYNSIQSCKLPLN